jgi:hypothetical protein
MRTMGLEVMLTLVAGTGIACAVAVSALAALQV